MLPNQAGVLSSGADWSGLSFRSEKEPKAPEQRYEMTQPRIRWSEHSRGSDGRTRAEAEGLCSGRESDVRDGAEEQSKGLTLITKAENKKVISGEQVRS